MTNRTSIRYSKLSLGLAMALAAAPVFAQNTTSAMGGVITNPSNQPVVGAEVVITHVESGSVSRATTDANGRYAARGLRTGGPYSVTITKDGVSATREGVYLELAETATVSASLGEQAQTLDTVKVEAGEGGSALFSTSAIGATTSISREQLDSFASIQRNLQDYARMDPRISQTDKERGEISAGGQNTRYNTVTIDSVNTSDTFGLEANTLPTAKQPISIDAIQAVQVNISNYDVTQRGYTGANINAVTKSGTNDFKGSVYYVYRNDKASGDRYVAATDSYVAPPESSDETVGFTFGGPIVEDKLFFFASAEDYKSTRIGSDFTTLGGSGTQVFITQAEIDAIRNIMQTRYSVDIGNTSAAADNILEVEDRLLKLDWNITDQHRASLRWNKTEESTPIFPGFGTRSLSLSSHWYTQAKTFEGLVGQWFADWSDNFSTEFKASRREYESVPLNNSDLPQVTVQINGGTAPPGVLGGNRTLLFGTERSRHFNELRTATDSLYFSGNLFLGEHELKAGVDWENNEIFNAFLQDTRGTYNFGCISSTVVVGNSPICAQSLDSGRPFTYSVQTGRPGQTLNDGVAQWELSNLGMFLQDTWSVNYNLTLVAGFRVDRTGMPDSPLFNPLVAAAPGPTVVTAGRPRATGGFGLNNSITMDSELLWQPRVGFNYTFDSERPTQLRGGFGLFQGSAANVWLSNTYSNTGRATQVIGCGIAGFAACATTGAGIFSPDTSNQPTTFAGTLPASNVDILHENLDQPSVWKANLAIERELPFWGAVLSAELILTEVEDGIYYQHLNLGAPTRSGVDGRALYWSPGGLNPACWGAGGGVITTGVCAGAGAVISRYQNNAAFNNVIAARPTSKGNGQNLSISLNRSRQNDPWSWSFAYSFTEATEVSPLTSSVANSNWLNNNTFNPNEEVAERANYVVRDRFVGTLGFRHDFFDGYATEFGLFYEGRKGKPYSWTYINDINGDGVSGNDLMYIPRGVGSGEVVFTNGPQTAAPVNDPTVEAQFWAIANQYGLSRFAGGVATRNADFASWTNSFDMRISQQLPGFMDGHKTELVLDVLNVGNLLNKQWGRIEEIGFPLNRSFVNYRGVDAQGRYVYGVGNLEQPFVRQARGESQWAAQITFRYKF